MVKTTKLIILDSMFIKNCTMKITAFYIMKWINVLFVKENRELEILDVKLNLFMNYYS